MPKCMNLQFNFIEIIVRIIRIDLFFLLRSLKKQKIATRSSLSSQLQILNTDGRLLNVKLRNVFKYLNVDRHIFISVTVAQNSILQPHSRKGNCVKLSPFFY